MYRPREARTEVSPGSSRPQTELCQRGEGDIERGLGDMDRRRWGLVVGAPSVQVHTHKMMMEKTDNQRKGHFTRVQRTFF